MTQRLAGLILMPWLVSLCFAQEATSPPASVAVPPWPLPTR